LKQCGRFDLITTGVLVRGDEVRPEWVRGVVELDSLSELRDD
jgi:hypothetical protein